MVQVSIQQPKKTALSTRPEGPALQRTPVVVDVRLDAFNLGSYNSTLLGIWGAGGRKSFVVSL
jgi:hypothetical protein